MFRLTINQRQSESLSVMLFASAMAISIIAIASLLGVILVNGTGHFWPTKIQLVEMNAGQEVKKFYGQLVSESSYSDRSEVTKQYRMTDWDRLGFSSVYIDDASNSSEGSYPVDVALLTLRSGSQVLAKPVSLISEHNAQPLSSFDQLLVEVAANRNQVEFILNNQIASLNSQLQTLDIAQEETRHQQLIDEYDQARHKANELKAALSSHLLIVEDALGTVYELPLNDIERYDYVNQYSLWGKFKYSLRSVWQFVSESPKQLYASGGVFPAIFGTVVMVLVMTIFVTPLGILVAIYLHEYAAQNRLTTLVRISINNMAGVPSIVYGVFGLSFFVYELGAGIDNWFFEETLPAPTFGAPGLFWASLTMAMLTLPVVVVATEEGLRRVPDSLRMGSYALGATQFETIRKTVIPMASPGIMTGIILAIARGAGEVAPLILVGAVKFAPTLPIDTEYPYIHFERQFMHLGVTVFDGAFQGQLAGSGSNMMFAACLFLLLIVVLLNIVAQVVRQRLRRQYNALLEH